MLVDLVNKFVSILKWHHCLINNMDGMESISNYFNASKEREFNDGSTYSLSYNLTPAFSRVLIDRHLVFCSRTRAVTRLENVRQLNIRQRKKVGSQLSHRKPL